MALISLVRRAYLHIAKPGRRGAVARAHDLLRLPLPAVGRAPQCPLVAGTNCIHRAPELGSNSAVGGVLQHSGTLAVFDFPSRFAAELEVVTLIVNRPGAVGFDVNAVIGGRDELLPGQRLFAGENADVGHADDRQVVPAIGAQSSARARRTNGMGGLAGTQIPGEQAIRNDGRALCRDTFVVEGKSAEARTVLLTCVRHDVNQVAAIAEGAQLV